jgi:Cu/Ag efflux protein CusF
MRVAILAAVVGCFILQGCNRQEEAAAPAEPGTYSSTGQIEVVNQDTVRIDHGPIAELEWPAMIMTYEVPDPAMVANLQPGANVSFSFKHEGFGYVLTDIDPQ